MDKDTKNAWIQLVIRFGLAGAIEIIEALNSATTDEDALTALRKARDKGLDQYIAEEKARRGL